MPKQFENSDQTFSSDLSENRFTALENVQSFLELNSIEMKNLFKVLCKADDGYLEFNFGEITIQFTRGFGVWSEDENVVRLSIELDKGVMGKTTTYEYKIKELQVLRKKKQLKIDNYGEK
jgi:hypothetical protein